MKQSVVRIVVNLMVAFGLTGGGLQAIAQHVHLYTGAETPQPGSRLIMINAGSFDTNSNAGVDGVGPECLFMRDSDPLYPGLYITDATFVSMPATQWTAGPAPGCAAPGAYLEGKVISVAGPKGSTFSLWQENDDGSQTVKLFSVPITTNTITAQFNISEGITYPEPDPFGHIHGRRFAVEIPGLYTVGFQIVDTSTGSTNGGPIHLPSTTNYFYLYTGVFINTLIKSNDVVMAQYGARSYSDYQLQANTNLTTTNWVKVDEYIGSVHTHVNFLRDTNATSAMRFYRLQETLQE